MISLVSLHWEATIYVDHQSWWLQWKSHLLWFLEDVDNAFSNHSNSSPIHCRHVKSLVDDLGFCRGVVFSRAATLLRSIETKPFDWEICPHLMDFSLSSKILLLLTQVRCIIIFNVQSISSTFISIFQLLFFYLLSKTKKFLKKLFLS